MTNEFFLFIVIPIAQLFCVLITILLSVIFNSDVAINFLSSFYIGLGIAKIIRSFIIKKE